MATDTDLALFSSPNWRGKTAVGLGIWKRYLEFDGMDAFLSPNAPLAAGATTALFVLGFGSKSGKLGW